MTANSIAELNGLLAKAASGKMSVDHLLRAANAPDIGAFLDRLRAALGLK